MSVWPEHCDSGMLPPGAQRKGEHELERQLRRRKTAYAPLSGALPRRRSAVSASDLCDAYSPTVINHTLQISTLKSEVVNRTT